MERMRLILQVPKLCRGLLLVTALCIPISASADMLDIIRCQKAFAKAGTYFATRAINAELKCLSQVALCELQCDVGFFGECTSSQPSSNPVYEECLRASDSFCEAQEVKVDNAEVRKQRRIYNACNRLSHEEICGGAMLPGLSFRVLDAGCQELYPGYECSLLSLLECVGGVREQRLTERISELLNPRGAAALQRRGRRSHGTPDSPQGEAADTTCPADL